MKSKSYGVPQQTANAKAVSKLKWARELKGYSQQSLADATGVSVKTIRSFECGYRDINVASVATVYRLATVLGVKMEELIDV